MATIREVTSFEDFKVQIVTSFPDLCVYVSKNKTEASGKDEIWFFDNSGARKIKFVNSFPDLKIQYVDSRAQAGWKNKSHKLQKRIE